MLICRTDNEFLVSIDYEQKEDLLKENTIIIPKQIKGFNLTSRYENITKIVFEKDCEFTFNFSTLTDVQYCFPNLEYVEISNNYYLSEDGIVYDTIHGTTLVFVPYKYKDKKLSIKKGIEYISERAIYKTWLESIEIPDSIIKIEPFAITFNNNLKKIVFPEKNISLLETCLSNNPLLEEVQNFNFIKDISKAPSLFSGCKNLKSIDFSGLTVPKLPNNLLVECEKIEKININTKLYWEIGHSCFENSGIKEFPFESAISLGVKSFSGTKIVSVELNFPLFAVETFSNCKELTDVVINHYNINVPAGSFWNCNNLKRVIFHNAHGTTEQNEYNIEANAFMNCENLTEIFYDSKPNIKNISQQAFYGCSKLLRFQLDNICAIETEAFRGCTSLTEIQINQKTDSILIYIGAFWDCKNLRTVKINSEVSLSDKAFNHCKKLETIEIEKISYMKETAFADCKKIKKITLGEIPSNSVINKMQLSKEISPFVKTIIENVMFS